MKRILIIALIGLFSSAVSAQVKSTIKTKNATSIKKQKVNTPNKISAKGQIKSSEPLNVHDRIDQRLKDEETKNSHAAKPTTAGLS